MMRLFMAVVVATSISSLAMAGVPQELNHQGKVSVSGVPFDGTGLFRFAIVDLDTGLNLWTNDNTNVGVIGTPTNAVSLPVVSGLYNVRLGNTNLANMGPIMPSVFAKDNTSLRIWFDDGINGAEQLLPDHKISASPYSHRVENGVPTGTIIAFGGSQVPNGWLLCDGADVLRATYPTLLAAIGTNWGAGDGSTTFHVPDLRGRFLRGWDRGAANDPGFASRTASNTGGNVGDAVGSFQLDQSQSHAHNPGTLFTAMVPTAGFNFLKSKSGGFTSDFRITGENVEGNATPQGTGIAVLGKTAAMTDIGGESRPTNCYVNYIIKY